MNILITGVAGFIGMHVAKRLHEDGHSIIGIDNLNEYYDKSLKEGRLNELLGLVNFKFEKIELSDTKQVNELFKKSKFDLVINLAAQAGVRYSVENPRAYISSNVSGFLNILEGCREFGVNNLIYASSSSVYGDTDATVFVESDRADRPLSLYAATKRSNELMAHSYSSLYGISTIGLRFFTAYGPWGRPDQSLFLFVDAIIKNRPINVFNNGLMLRDFTYIEDISEVISRVVKKITPLAYKVDTTAVAIEETKYAIYNVGSSNPISLLLFIEEIEKKLNKKAIKNYLPLQLGDVISTSANNELLFDFIKYKPSTSIEAGVTNFIDWYLKYYKVLS